MEINTILRSLELFHGLTDQELEEIETICSERIMQPQEIITSQGKYSDELFIITDGFVEVLLSEGIDKDTRVLVNLGEGQIIGEMALVDQGPRSATVRASAKPTKVQVIRREDLDSLCHHNPRIGYMIMRNIATDLSFKLRHRNLSEGGI